MVESPKTHFILTISFRLLHGQKLNWSFKIRDSNNQILNFRMRSPYNKTVETILKFSQAIYLCLEALLKPVRTRFLMPIKCYASFWDMWKAGVVRLSLISTHIYLGVTYKRPGLSLVARWTKYPGRFHNAIKM